MRDYKQIIENNRRFMINNDWYLHAYHFTSLENAVNIVRTGYIYSRKLADQNGLMKNDNASESVISQTKDYVKDYARFYFRPKTPTQFNNEGFKQVGYRMHNKNGISDIHADIPVPVFFVFDLNEMLSSGNVFFSEISLALQTPSELKSGPASFEKLPFDKIYQTYSKERKYKHAEIVIKDKYPLDAGLQGIYFRSEGERKTFIRRIRSYEDGSKLIKKYYNFYKVDTDYDNGLFERNGIYVENFDYKDGEILINLNNPDKYIAYVKKQEGKDVKMKPLQVKLHYFFYNANHRDTPALEGTEVKPYCFDGTTLKFKINLPDEDTKLLGIEVYFKENENKYVLMMDNYVVLDKR